MLRTLSDLVPLVQGGDHRPNSPWHSPTLRWNFHATRNKKLRSGLLASLIGARTLPVTRKEVRNWTCEGPSSDQDGLIGAPNESVSRMPELRSRKGVFRCGQRSALRLFLQHALRLLRADLIVFACAVSVSGGWPHQR